MTDRFIIGTGENGSNDACHEIKEGDLRRKTVRAYFEAKKTLRPHQVEVKNMAQLGTVLDWGYELILNNLPKTVKDDRVLRALEKVSHKKAEAEEKGAQIEYGIRLVPSQNNGTVVVKLEPFTEISSLINRGIK